MRNLRPSRSEELICVVQDVRDLLAIESTQQFYGKYHVLGGVISLWMELVQMTKINELKKKNYKRKYSGNYISTSTTMEGDTTNFYIHKAS